MRCFIVELRLLPFSEARRDDLVVVDFSREERIESAAAWRQMARKIACYQQSMNDVVLPRSEVDALADAIAVAAATIDSASHGLLALIRRFDETKGWAWQGAKTCAHWLSWRIGDGLGAAREKVRVARALGGLPAIDEALRQGKVSYAKVRAMTRVASAENEALLLQFASASTGAGLERICRGFRRVERTREDGGRARDPGDERFVRKTRLASGMVRIEAVVTADEAELVFHALREVSVAARVSAETSEGDDSSRAASSVSVAALVRSLSDGRGVGSSLEAGAATGANLADALVMLAETRLGASARKGAERNQILVHLSEQHVSAETRAEGAGPCGWKAELADGSWLSGQALLRLACDAGVVVAKVGSGGGVLDVGRKLRTVSPALLRALHLRDGGCRFPSCAHRVFVEAHHLRHWAHGGDTSLENTLLLCSRHHRAVHEEGFRVERCHDGSHAFYDPSGAVIPYLPPPAPPAPIRPAAAAVIHRTTNLPEWDGGLFDLHAAVGALLAKGEVGNP